MCWTKKSSLAPKDGLIDNIGLPHVEPFSRVEPFLTPMVLFLGNCLIFDAKLWGILDGLKLIQRRGHSSVVIHFDSLEVVKAIHGNISKISNSALIRRIHRILSQESQWI
ncbi:hypothetical protein Goari_010807 [Gossypium aridum]|uniref:RNase H type-1 domain-containing protein n=1 Tax=Gossypium aridum TaxID=34290 RepID=A0A7J8Y163_GOSAI|nr:hypothetical protein [Gossypium aridum]